MDPVPTVGDCQMEDSLDELAGELTTAVEGLLVTRDGVGVAILEGCFVGPTLPRPSYIARVPGSRPLGSFLRGGCLYLL
jgi:hypothetical protein